MNGDNRIDDVPLSLLSYKTRRTLSTLLNSLKVLHNEKPDRLYRDWRGIASLLNISAEVAASIRESKEKEISKVLEIWIQRHDGTATVGTLLRYLEHIDRFDVCDDILQLAKDGELVAKHANSVSLSDNKQVAVSSLVEEDFSVITVEDRPGYTQHYHAYVLYADEDEHFVKYELIDKLKHAGFKICCQDDLLPGHATQYAAVSQLISDRCHRIILVYSPDFLRSSANSFYMDYAQAVSIEQNRRKIIPIMYRDCQLPSHLTFYHNLYYKTDQRAMYDFWKKLYVSLQMVALPGYNYRGLNGASSTTQMTASNINITELNSKDNMFQTKHVSRDELFISSDKITEAPQEAEHTVQKIQTLRPYADDTHSLSGSSQVSHSSQNSVEKKKKTGPLKKFINTLKGKKQKKAILVEN